jgi:hypothetical protein
MPFEPRMPETVSEMLRVTHAVIHGPAIRGREVYVVASGAPLHPVFATAGSRDRARALYDEAETPRPGWTSDDARTRMVFGPLRMGDIAGPAADTTSDAAGGGTGSSSSGTVASFMPMYHTCWTDPVQLELVSGEASLLSDLPCSSILGATIQVEIYTAAGTVSVELETGPNCDAIFFTRSAAERYLMREYLGFYGPGYVNAIRRRFGL